MPGELRPKPGTEAAKPSLSSSPSSSSSSDSAGADKPAQSVTKRKKVWAPRVRTGCTTCRTHHRKCDEAKPVCGHCQRTRRPCHYKLKWQPPDAVPEKKPFRPIVPAPKLQPLEPPDWEFTEAGRYYFCIMLPLLSQTLVADTPQQALLAPIQYDLSGVISTTNFIMVAVAHRITTICAHHRRPVRSGEWPAINHLWKSMYTLMAKAVAELNDSIRNKAHPRKIMISLNGLLGSEMTVRDSPWRAHLRGIAAFLESCGGVDAYMRDVPPPSRAVQFGCVIGILSNTTSPSRDQLLGFHKFTDDQVLRVYGVAFFNLLPCPSCLFIELYRITRLRVTLVDISDALITALIPVAMGIAKRIADFEPDDWSESYDIPKDPIRPILARLFKNAITMYAVLSLPPVLGSLFGPSHELNKTDRLKLRDRLLRDMEEAHKTYPRLDSLSWIVAVLGVAFHDGTSDDKERILVILDTLIGMPGVYSGPSALFDRLQRFWLSGKSSWDACFYKPTHTIA